MLAHFRRRRDPVNPLEAIDEARELGRVALARGLELALRELSALELARRLVVDVDDEAVAAGPLAELDDARGRAHAKE